MNPENHSNLDRFIIVITGPSGVGKTTLYKKVLELLSDKLAFSISATTRPPRSGENNGIDYYFLSEQEFKNKIDNNEFIEWAKVHNNYYGTLKSEIERIVSVGKFCLLDVDVQGGESIKRDFPGCHRIFILPPSIDELKRRLSSRQSDNAEINKTRIKNAEQEVKYALKYQYQIVNDNLEHALERMTRIIKNIIHKVKDKK